MRAATKIFLAGITLLGFNLASSRASVVTLSVVAVASQTKAGYTSGQSYSFSLNLTGDFQSSDSTYNAFSMEWLDAGSGPIRLWSTFSGDFADGGGTYSQTSPSTYFNVNMDGPSLEFSVYNLGNTVGVQALDGTDVTQIYCLFPSDFYTSSPTSITPENYFAGFPNPSFASGASMEITTTSSDVTFDVTSVNVVPEPSTWALIGLSIVGITIFRRKLIPLRQ